MVSALFLNMSNKQSGSAVNELEYYGYLIAERQRAIDLLTKLKSIDKPKVLIQVNHYTFETEGFRELMERKRKVKVIFKRTNE